MENKFKPGDKVVCGDESFSTFGKVGVVIERSIYSDLYDVECEGTVLSYYEDELTAAPDETAPKPEWDGVFRVGDKGLTRGGWDYEVISVTADESYCCTPQPIIARRASDDSERGYTADGLFFKEGETSVNDLLPPTERGPDVAELERMHAVGSGERQTITVPIEGGKAVMTSEAVAALMRRVAELEAEREALSGAQARIDELVDVLRSARAIAERKGMNTAWGRFSQRIGDLGISSVTAKVFKVLPDEVPANDNKPGVRVYLVNDETHDFDNAEWFIENGGQVAVHRNGKVVARYFEGRTYGVAET